MILVRREVLIHEVYKENAVAVRTREEWQAEIHLETPVSVDQSA